MKLTKKQKIKIEKATLAFMGDHFTSDWGEPWKDLDSAVVDALDKDIKGVDDDADWALAEAADAYAGKFGMRAARALSRGCVPSLTE